jgi:hypothetical protein
MKRSERRWRSAGPSASLPAALRSRELDAGAGYRPASKTLEGITHGRGELERLAAEGALTGARVQTVDCAGEVAAASNYYYSSDEAAELPPAGDKPRVVIIGSGPNRIGQGIEFTTLRTRPRVSGRRMRR